MIPSAVRSGRGGGFADAMVVHVIVKIMIRYVVLNDFVVERIAKDSKMRMPQTECQMPTTAILINLGAINCM